MAIEYLPEEENEYEAPPQNASIEYIDEPAAQDVTGEAYSSPVREPESELTQSRREMFREEPWYNKILGGMGKTFKSTLVNPVSQAGQYYFGEEGDYEQRVAEHEAEIAAYKDAAGGDPLSFSGEFGTDVGMALYPASKATSGAAAITKAPGLLRSTLAGLGAGGTSAIQHQLQNIGEGRDIDPFEAGMEVGISGALPGTGKVLKRGLKGANKFLGAAAEELSGVSEEALRKYGTGYQSGSKEMIEVAGKQNELGNKLLDMVDNFEDYLPENKVIGNALKNMPDMDISKTLKIIDDEIAKFPLKRTNSKSIDRLQTLRDDLSEAKTLKGRTDVIPGKVTREATYSAGRGPHNPRKLIKPEIKTNTVTIRTPDRIIRKTIMPSSKYYNNRIQIDDLVDWNKPGAKNLDKSMLKIRTSMANDLVETAKKSGNAEYIGAMTMLSDKLQTRDKLFSILGNSSQARENRVGSFLDNLFNRNKETRQAIIKDVGDIFGKDFISQAKLIELADQLGPKGKPTLLPRQKTGRALLGSALGSNVFRTAAAGASGAGAVANPVMTGIGVLGGAGLTALGSPKLASAGLGLADLSEIGLSKFFNSKAAQSLAPYAGQITRSTLADNLREE